MRQNMDCLAGVCRNALRQSETDYNAPGPCGQCPECRIGQADAARLQYLHHMRSQSTWHEYSEVPWVVSISMILLTVVTVWGSLQSPSDWFPLPPPPPEGNRNGMAGQVGESRSPIVDSPKIATTLIDTITVTDTRIIMGPETTTIFVSDDTPAEKVTIADTETKTETEVKTETETETEAETVTVTESKGYWAGMAKKVDRVGWA